MQTQNRRMEIMASPPARGHPWFAAIYDVVNQWGDRHVLRPLREQVAGGAVGRVLEIGAGTGANFPFYTVAARVVATDPDPFMLQRAFKRAAAVARDIELLQCAAEVLPF